MEITPERIEQIRNVCKELIHSHDHIRSYRYRCECEACDHARKLLYIIEQAENENNETI